MAVKDDFKVVGHSVDKLDSLNLACGKPMFTADLAPRGMLYARILPSPHAHALIKSINVDRARALPGVKAVLTYKDVPRNLHTTAGQGYPEPSPYDTAILDYKVRHVGDRVAAVAAESLEIAEEALGLIEVEYEVLPAVLDMREAMKDGAPVIHDEKDAKAIIPVPYDPKRNLAAQVEMSFGELEAGFKNADVVIEQEYLSHYAQHCPIEPHVCLTYLDENDRLVIRTSTQVPFHARRITALALGIPVKKIRVIKPRIGGGFGTKQEVLLEQLCAALTLATRRPVLLELTREEEFISSRTRHPQVLWLKTGVKKDGSLAAHEMKIIMNTGAYGSHALTVVCNSGSKNLPLYRFPAVHFLGQTVYTNLPVGGAYRGYGATQAAFAQEVQMDMLAERLGMDPLEFRKTNTIKEGETSPVFRALGEGKEGVDQAIGSCGLAECIEKGAAAIGWKQRGRLPAEGAIKRGIGVALLMQGSSIPEIDMGGASIKINEDGSFNLLVGATDLGTGSDTILAQIAAEVLTVKADDIIVYSSDTDMTPFDVGAYASSTTYLTGEAVRKAALEIKGQILAVAGEMLMKDGEKLEDLTETLRMENAVVKAPDGRTATFPEIAIYSLYETNQFQIAAFASHITHKSPPPFAAHFAQVAVDTETGLVKVEKYVAAVDCGTAINPALAEGQTEGAVMNGICFALTEEYIFNQQGRMQNPHFGDYKIYSPADLMDLKTILVPTYESTGPFGAKSVSEISINGPMPAIANAIFDAVGIRLFDPPFTPEKVLAAIKAAKQS